MAKMPYGDYVTSTNSPLFKERYSTNFQKSAKLSPVQPSPMAARMQAMKKRLGGK